MNKALIVFGLSQENMAYLSIFFDIECAHYEDYYVFMVPDSQDIINDFLDETSIIGGEVEHTVRVFNGIPDWDNFSNLM